MLPLREATLHNHKKAEQMAFNVKMFKGELSQKQYLAYLEQQHAIFKVIESKGLPNSSLSRLDAVTQDIQELVVKGNSRSDLTKTTEEYTSYLNELNANTILPHVYLNYLAIAFGGQIMKKKVPSSGKMYNFENKKEAIKSVRDVQKDEWAEEVNRAYEYLIGIFNDLEKIES